MDKKEDIVIKPIKNNIDLNNYIKELQEDTKLTKFNLKEKSLMVSTLKFKWLMYLFKEKDNLKRIKNYKDKIIKTKIGEKQTSVLRMKSENILSENNDNIKKLNLMMENVKTNIEFLERTMNIIDSLGFDIKNTIELIKLEK